MVRNLNQIDEIIFETYKTCLSVWNCKKNRETFLIVDVMSFQLDEFFKKTYVVLGF